MNVNATLSFEEMGPTNCKVRRSSCSAALAESFSSFDFALVVVDGCTRRVAASARCWGAGTYAGASVGVP